MAVSKQYLYYYTRWSHLHKWSCLELTWNMIFSKYVFLRCELQKIVTHLEQKYFYEIESDLLWKMFTIKIMCFNLSFEGLTIAIDCPIHYNKILRYWKVSMTNYGHSQTCHTRDRALHFQLTVQSGPTHFIQRENFFLVKTRVVQNCHYSRNYVLTIIIGTQRSEFWISWKNCHAGGLWV